MKAQCNECGRWFKISPELNNLIEEGIIYPTDINLCPDCAEIEQERAEHDEYLKEVLAEL